MGSIRGNPVLIESRSHEGRRLERVPLTDKFVNEGWVQERIRLHQELLPIGEIEPGLGKHVSIGWEVNAGGGSIDNLFITSSGVLVVAECKLWRNRQQSREVLAQLLDYARVARTWRYGQIERIALEYFAKHKLPHKSLYEAVKAHDANIAPESEFSDAVDRHLADGKMLLLAVGEGIREGLRGMADMVGGAPDMLYRVALIEVALYRLAGAEWPILCVPTVVAETVELTRGVIRVRYEPEHRPTISMTEVDNAEAPSAARRMSISEDLFMQDLDAAVAAKKVSTDLAQATKVCLAVLKQEVDAEWNKGGTGSSMLAKIQGKTAFGLYTIGHLYPSFLATLGATSNPRALGELRGQFEAIFGKPIYHKKKVVTSQAYFCTPLTQQAKRDAFVELVRTLKAQWPKLSGSEA